MRLSLLTALAALCVIVATAGSANATSQHSPCVRVPVADLQPLHAAGRLRADVDGDGTPDTVTVRYEPHVPARCALYLVVSTAHRVYSRHLGIGLVEIPRDAIDAPVRQHNWESTVPTVEEIADLGDRGDVVVLSVGPGAANLGISFFGISGGRLRLLRIAGGATIWPGGTVMDQDVVNCAGGGPMREFFVSNVASRKHPNRWSFSSVTYKLRGFGFVAVAHRAVYGSNAKVNAAAKRAGMLRNHGYLSGCAVARDPKFIG